MPPAPTPPPPPANDTDAAALRRRVAELADEVAVLRQTLAMRQSNTEATYRAVFDSVNDAIFIQDVDTGVIVDVNRTAASEWGFGREELLGGTLSMLAAGEGAAPPAGAWERAAAGETQRFEMTCKRRDGAPVSAEVTLKRVHLAGHDRVLGVLRDVGERKERERLQEELIEAQARMLAELSTPLIPISDRVVVMPLIGTMDPRRAEQALETLLSGISRSGADVAILDVTGVTRVDTQVADALLRTAQAVRLLGARLMLTGIRPEIAQTMVGLGVSLQGIATHATLQAGVAAALR